MDIPLYVSTSQELSGIRCIKASRRIAKGELIESCPVILIPYTHWDQFSQTVLSSYSYLWDDDHDAVVLGYCGLSNHSYSANARYERNLADKRLEYYAVKDIAQDEEILINYNGNPRDATPLEEEYVNYKY